MTYLTPKYTKTIRDKSEIYIKDTIVLKDRNNEFNLNKDTRDYDGIVIEDKYSYVDIYCTKERENEYQNIKKVLYNFYNKELINKICIHVQEKSN